MDVFSDFMSSFHYVTLIIIFRKACLMFKKLLKYCQLEPSGEIIKKLSGIVFDMHGNKGNYRRDGWTMDRVKHQAITRLVCLTDSTTTLASSYRTGILHADWSTSGYQISITAAFKRSMPQWAQRWK